MNTYQMPEPQSIEEALVSDLSIELKQATNTEYKSLMVNQT